MIKTKGKQEQNRIKTRYNTNNGTNHNDKGETRPEHNKNMDHYKRGYKP